MSNFWDDPVGQTFGGAADAISDLGHGIAQTWEDAGRGEIGKYVSGFGQSIWNIPAGLHQAITTGRWDTGLQKVGGSALNLASGGTFSYLGQSSGVQNVLRDENLNKWTGGVFEDVAGITHGTYTASKEGVLSNSDRNLALQGLVKAGAAYGAYAAYSAYTAPVAGNQATGAILIEDASSSGAPWAAEGVVTSADIGMPEVAGDFAGQAAGEAAGSTAWYDSILSGAGSILKTGAEIGIAKQILGPNGAGGIGDIYGSDSANPYPLIPNLSDFFPSNGGSTSPAVISQPQSSIASKPNATIGAGTALLLAMGTFLLVRKLSHG
jgi:hypothetical protein